MGDRVKRVMRGRGSPPAARDRPFTSRLGNQFAAAITYFSVLAIAPSS